MISQQSFFQRFSLVKYFRAARRSCDGFTLIELMVVIAIIAILAVIGGVVYSGVQSNVRDAKRKSDVNAIALAYENNYAGNLYHPIGGNDFASNIIPVPPEGGSYSGLISGVSSGFQICAVLGGQSVSSCSEPSSNCFCKRSTQGQYVANGPLPSGGGGPLPTPLPAVLSANTMVFDSNRTGNHEIFAMDLVSETVYQITHNSSYDSWWGRISPDRTKILFYRNSAGSIEDYTTTSLWMMNADGSNPHLILAQGAFGWAAHGHAEWLNSNNRLIMFGGPGGSLQIDGTDINGQNPEIYTIRSGTNLDPAPNPVNDSNFLFIGCETNCTAPGSEVDYEVYIQPKTAYPNLSTATRLTNDAVRDHDPYFSPNVSQIAWLRNSGAGDANPNGLYWSIWKMNINGTGKTAVIADNNINSRPEWSKNGQWIYFHRFVLGQSSKFDIYRIRPDGTGLTGVTVGQPGVNQYPSL